VLSIPLLGIEKVTDKLGIGFVSGIAGFLRRNVFRVEAIALIGLAITAVMVMFASPAAAAIGGSMMSAMQAIPANAATHGGLSAFGNFYGAAIVNGWNGLLTGLGAFFTPILEGAGFGGQAAINAATVSATTTNTAAAASITPVATNVAMVGGGFGGNAAIATTNAALQVASIPVADPNTLEYMCQIAQSRCMSV
jgi:hypothetical protein